MTDQTEKFNMKIAMHPKDYEAMEAASKMLKLAPDDYCKLVIHNQSRKILERAKEPAPVLEGTKISRVQSAELNNTKGVER